MRYGAVRSRHRPDVQATATTSTPAAPAQLAEPPGDDRPAVRLRPRAAARHRTRSTGRGSTVRSGWSRNGVLYPLGAADRADATRRRGRRGGRAGRGPGRRRRSCRRSTSRPGQGRPQHGPRPADHGQAHRSPRRSRPRSRRAQLSKSLRAKVRYTHTAQDGDARHPQRPHRRSARPQHVGRSGSWTCARRSGAVNGPRGSSLRAASHEPSEGEVRREGRRTAGPPCSSCRSFSRGAGLVRSEREVGRGRSSGGP